MHKFLSWKVLLPFLATFFLTGCGVLQVDVVDSSTITAPATENTPTMITTETLNPAAGTDKGTDSSWVRTACQIYAISFERPSTWKGPVEEELSDTTQGRQIRIMIGSDMVEPWDMETNPYPAGAYVITITFLENASQTSLGDLAARRSELHAWTDLNLVSNGQSTVVNKLQYTRVDSIAAEEFRGLEFIAATPPNAQASVVYIHYAVLGNSRDQYLIVYGEIPNPGPKTAETWAETFRAVDERYQDIFRHVVASIRVG